jgi:hypothetical protein
MLGKGYLCAVVKDSANWPTPATRDHHSQGANHKETVAESHEVDVVSPEETGSQQRTQGRPARQTLAVKGDKRRPARRLADDVEVDEK